MFTVGTSLEGKGFMIESASVAETKKGSKYLKIVFRDKQHSISGNLWDYNEGLHGFIKAGAVVKLSGLVEEYAGAPQMKVGKIEPSSEPVMSFARSTQFNVEEMWGSLVERIDKLSEPLTRFISEEILLNSGIVEAYCKAPAARGVHNAFYGGLLEHVWSLCQLADGVVSHYQKHYEPRISRDKIIFGILLHDAGKISEYDYTTPAFSYTAIGQLTPHIVLGSCWVYEKANKWWEKNKSSPILSKEEFVAERAHLVHCISSHHGQLDWGSPVKPASIEAVILHHLDNLDSKVMHAHEQIQNTIGQIPGFSERSRIEGVSFLRYR